MVKKYVIYARFSSDVQNETSATDQIFECEEYVRERGGVVAGIYKDEGISGATVFRADYQRLLKDIAQKKFNVLLAEGLDRLSRNQGDIAKLYELLEYYGVELQTLSEGTEINSMHIAFKGMANSQFLKDLRDKTIRGLKGRIREGKNPGSCPYGFDVSRELQPDGRKVVTGELIPVEREIDIIKRIFTEYADGRSPQQIADRLNAEHVPGPRSKVWSASTINGDKRSGGGIINNETYIGRRIWNRTSYKKNPATGKKTLNYNPESEWIVRDAPELRVIGDNLWKSVKARQEEITNYAHNKCKKNELTGKRRHHYVLSGLIKCGECGSDYVMNGGNYYGCTNHKAHRGCMNGRMARRDTLENEVFALIRNELLEPRRIKILLEAYRAHTKTLQAETDQKHRMMMREIAKIDKSLEFILRAIESGIYSKSTQTRLLELEAKKEELERQMIPLPDIIVPDDHVIANYRTLLKNLSKTIEDETIRYQAITTLRPLIEKVVLSPTETGLRGEFFGSLSGLLDLNHQISNSLRSETHRYLTLPPMIFIITHPLRGGRR